LAPSGCSATKAFSVIVLGQYACQDEGNRSFAKSRLHLRLLAHRVQTPLEIADDFGLDLHNFRSVKPDLPHPPCKQVR
jgi:hypothetical protein